jgi:hypothetical protein
MDGPFYRNILANAIRSPDPYLKVHGSWIVRRLAPDCRRLELASLIRANDEEWLLHAMGFETANVHLGTAGGRRSIAQHLVDFTKKELRKAATTMSDALAKDFRHWQNDD